MNVVPSSVLHRQVPLGIDLLQPRAEWVFCLLAAAVSLSYPEAKPLDSDSSPTFLFLSFPSSFHYRKLKEHTVRSVLSVDTCCNTYGYGNTE